MADENRGDMLQAARDTICFVCWVLFFGTLFSRMCHMLKLAILQYMRCALFVGVVRARPSANGVRQKE